MTIYKSMQAFIIVVAILFLFFAYMLTMGKCQEGEVEEFRPWRRRWWGRHGGFLGGWPYYSGYYTGWPPYLYGGQYTSRCVATNEASDCDPYHPVKIGIDSNDDGIKDRWRCCKY